MTVSTPAASRASSGGGQSSSPGFKILFRYYSLSSFIREDLELIQARPDVRIAACRPLWRTAGAALACWDTDCVFCWFGSLRFLPICLMARLLGKRVVIITGGYDVAAVPEIQYGNMRPGLTRTLGRLLFKLADLAVCYSQSAVREATENAGIPPARQRLVYLGFDERKIGASSQGASKERLVLTVAGVTASTLHRKGLLSIAAMSRLMPDVPFVIAGSIEPKAGSRLAAAGGPNLTLTGYLSDDELADLYRRAKVYFQPSVHEAFGCSVAEAMLHNCTPVVTARYSLPEVVGECGYYVDLGDFRGMADALRRALEGPPPGPESPRERIVREFPASNRRESLLRLLQELA
jgi:glycosyltransferase involved in cell wall biosynthesis